MSEITIIYECIRCGKECAKTRDRRHYRNKLPLYCYDCIHNVTKDTLRFVRWTDADCARLKLLWERGESVEAIATDLGRTPTAITNKRIQQGLSTRDEREYATAEQVAEVRRMWNGGYTYGEMAAKLHMSRCRVAGIIARHVNTESVNYGAKAPLTNGTALAR